MESFYSVKDHDGRMGRWDWDKLFSVKCLRKDWWYKEPQGSTVRKQTIQLQKKQKA